MPHIAVLFEFPTLNGGERSMLAVLERLSRNNDFRFSAIAAESGDLADELTRLGIQVSPFSVREHGRKQSAEILHQQLRRIIGELQPDVLHSNSLSMSRLAGQLELPCSVRRTGHLRDILKLNATVIADLNANDALIAVSHATRQFHLSQGLNPDSCTVIHNGVDLHTFRPRDSTDARSRLFPDVPASVTLLLNVGQICLRKGQLHLAKSICELLKTRDDIHLVIAGERHSQKAESIAYEAAIHEQFAAMGASCHLHMLGYRNDIPELMNAADLLVHTALQEPFGRTLLEAAASGLPIIATDVGGTTEMLRNQQDAILLEPKDQTKLVSAMAELIDNKSRRQQLAKSASQQIQDFTATETARKMSTFWTTGDDSQCR